MTKPRVATVWLEGCSGCHMSLLDLDEALLEVLGAVEFTVSPVTDFKNYEFPDLALGIVEGAVGNSEHLEVVHKLRAKCGLLLALGDCAVFGGVNKLRNAIPLPELLRKGYTEAISSAGAAPPEDPRLPALLPSVQAVQDAVKVDGFLPGCPPSPQVILHGLKEVLAGRPPVVPPGLLHWD